MTVDKFQLAAEVVAEAHRVLPVEEYRTVLKTVRGLVRESGRLPGPELGPFIEEE